MQTLSRSKHQKKLYKRKTEKDEKEDEEDKDDDEEGEAESTVKKPQERDAIPIR